VEDPEASVEASSDDSDSVPGFSDNEDDSDKEEDQEAVERAAAWQSGEGVTELRYEAANWLFHLKQAEDLWTEDKRQISSDWQDVMLQLDNFVYSDAFQIWQRQHWKIEAYIPIDWWYKPDVLTPLHVAAAYSLTDLVRQLLDDGKFKVTDPIERSSQTVLHIAALANPVHVPILELLSEHEPDSELPNVENEALQISPFHHLLIHDISEESIVCFLKHGAL
jgi:hypothetical protein